MHLCLAKFMYLCVNIGVIISRKLCKETSNNDEGKKLLMGLHDCYKEYKNENLDSGFLSNCCH